MSFDDPDMDLEEMLQREAEVFLPEEEEPPEPLDLNQSEDMCTNELFAVDGLKKILSAAAPSSKALTSCVGLDLAAEVASPASSSSSTIGSPIKKRRLTVKTSCEYPIFVAPALLPVHAVGVLWLKMTEMEFNNMSFRQQYTWVYNKCRKGRADQRIQTKPILSPKVPDVEMEEDTETSFQQISERCELMQSFMLETNAPSWLAEWAKSNMFQVKKPEVAKWLQAKSVLLTYNGPWGVLEVKPAAACSDNGPEGLCLQIGESTEGKLVIAEFFAFVQMLVQHHHVMEWAASVELCTTTLSCTGVVRLHCHVFMRKHKGKFNARHAGHFCFKDSTPDKRCSTTGGKHRNNGSYAAMYYLQCPKHGMVATSGSHQPFVDYGVNGSWIFSLVQGLKMKYLVARTELIKTTQGLTRKLADIDRWHVEVSALSLEQRVHERVADLHAQMMPFRVMPTVENWKQKFTSLVMRKKFLVLEGPSGVAKTAYAMSLWGKHCTLELNMAGTDHFCLRNFNPAQHKAIVWDEARPSLVSSQRKLFQCGPSWVDLGQSPTGAHVYRVWLNDAVMIVCSNHWTDGLDNMKHSDAEWIRANQVHVVVTTSLVA
jgi:hypothetical protein